MKNSKLDAIHFCFRNKRATEKVLENFMKHFPDASVSLIVDKGGFDFSYMKSEKVNVFHFDDFNMGGTGENAYLETARMISLFTRVKKAITPLSAKYILILEDDVLVRNHFDPESMGEFVIGNGLMGPHYPDNFKAVWPALDQWGLSGGSIFHRNQFLNIFDDCIQFIEKFHEEMKMQFRAFGAFDCCATFHFARHGHTLKMAPWISEGSVIHPWKEMYPLGWRNDNQVEWENQ